MSVLPACAAAKEAAMTDLVFLILAAGLFAAFAWLTSALDG
jgi:hypothetical protein